MITRASEIVQVEEYSNAHLECLVNSNPVNERVISWVRRKNETDQISILNLNPSSYEDDEFFYNRMRSDVEILNEESALFADGAKMKSSLYIMNATLQDSGTSFDCIANNGVGKEAKSTVTLLVLRKFVHLMQHLFHMQIVYS